MNPPDELKGYYRETDRLLLEPRTHLTVQYPTSVGSSLGSSREGFVYSRRGGAFLPRNHQGMRIHAMNY